MQSMRPASQRGPRTCDSVRRIPRSQNWLRPWARARTGQLLFKSDGKKTKKWMDLGDCDQDRRTAAQLILRKAGAARFLTCYTLIFCVQYIWYLIFHLMNCHICHEVVHQDQHSTSDYQCLGRLWVWCCAQWVEFCVQNKAHNHLDTPPGRNKFYKKKKIRIDRLPYDWYKGYLDG